MYLCSMPASQPRTEGVIKNPSFSNLTNISHKADFCLTFLNSLLYFQPDRLFLQLLKPLHLLEQTRPSQSCSHRRLDFISFQSWRNIQDHHSQLQTDEKVRVIFAVRWFGFIWLILRIRESK